jgi:hypothetical protein
MNGDRSFGRRPPEDTFTATPCSTNVELYLHPLLEEPPVRSSVPVATWQTYEEMATAARTSCAACPLLDDCLYKAVAQTDVSGYVGCTSASERAAIRRILGVRIEPEDVDAWAGIRGTRQPVDHEEVVRMRAAHPDDSLEMLAARLDCSLSTVKRHLRRARSQSPPGTTASAGGRRLPSMDEVFEAFEQVVDPHRAAR